MTLHPIVEQMKPSDEQRPAIQTRGRDVVVTAGAGAGKTLTLVARYLALLAEDVPLRSILAITFTKKAAREMRNRVREKMRVYLDRADLRADERARWQTLYSELDAARIYTIHGLGAEILRAHPAEANLDPRFAILDDGADGVLRAQAIDETLAWASDDARAATLFALLGENDLRDTLADLLMRRLDARAAFAKVPTDARADWQNYLRAHQDRVLNDLLANQDWRDADATLRENRADDANDKMEIQRVAARAALDAAPQLSALGQLAAINLTGGKASAWRGGKAQVDQVRATLKTLRDLWNAATFVEWNACDDQLADAYPALRAAFDYASERYAALKAGQDALDFDDLECSALELLTRDAAVCARWQNEAHAILVDEFQDTNQRQRDLIDRLNGAGGKLFIVGDAKQSIYRFRGADVAVFRHARRAIQQRGGADETLATSYRAHRALIEGLNDLLAPILGDQADDARPWIEPFAALKHQRESADPGFDSPHIEIQLSVGAKKAGALARAADALAARLNELVSARACKFDQIAILCRASTSFGAYEDACERADIPFLTVAGRGFYHRPEIRDVLNLLQAIADPTDDLALVGLLRSPAGAWSDPAIYRLVESRAANESLWNVLQTRVEPDAARVINLVRDLHARVGRASVADLLKQLLDATDYRAAWIARGHARAARNISKLLADAHASGIGGVGEFLEYVATLRDVGTREGEARATSDGAIQIMSVHAAKGLEFPVVVIGDIASTAPHRHAPILHPELGALLPLKNEMDIAALYRLGAMRERELEDAELTRLLYVAATRAKEKLILNGCVDLDKTGAFGKAKGWFGAIGRALNLAETRVAYDEQGARVHRFDWRVGNTPIAGALYEPNAIPATRIARSTDSTVPALILPPPLLARIQARQDDVDAKTQEFERAPSQRVWRVMPDVKYPTAPAWVIGKLVHEALAQWRFPDAQFETWVAARARAYGIADRAQTQDAERVTRQLLARFFDHALRAEMEIAEQRWHEVPYSILVDGKIENGTLDVLYARAGVWTIIEFKTDHVRDQDALAQKLKAEDYTAQARRYADAVARLIRHTPRVGLCFLDVARALHVQWLERSE
ncbi:MAG: UvrD-helicase domain-containing protein [Chloroflexi bacterium]|nr:UvrD-helicase domain-containing protein [Chloroflexota bacterium]